MMRPAPFPSSARRPSSWQKPAVTGLGLLAIAALLLVGCAAKSASTADRTSVADPVPTTEDLGAPTPSSSTDPDAAIDATDLAATELAESTRPLPSAKGLPPLAEGPLPVAISFASIGVDSSPIDGVGVEPNGEMEIPSALRVGWYEYGSRPGQAGSTVLAAHIASDGVDGVFRHLADVTVGDRFEVSMDDGTTIPYEVLELAQYNKEDLPFDRIFARDGAPTIALVTCGGSFQPSLRSYEDNVVAYAAPIDN